MKYSLFVMLIMFLALVACTEEKAIGPDLGYDFYPLQVGKYWIYQVDSIIYDDEGLKVDTVHLFFREEITDWRLNNIGDTAFVAERFESYDSVNWQIKEVFSLERTRTQALRNENNLRFIKLIFPINRNERWDGNRFFDSSIEIPVAGENIQPFLYWEYRYTNVEKGIVTVQLADYEENVNIRQAEEKYAEGIGLTERTWVILSTQCGGNGTLDCGDLPWAEKAERGFIIHQRLVAHN
ncbi:MAG: hypothetical protein SFU99_21945 [Saprospiraceae bacterium]|nr:hypothetical protein [Saprospiraceae bacterium]